MLKHWQSWGPPSLRPWDWLVSQVLSLLFSVSIYLFVGNKVWDSVIGNYQLSFAILFIVVSCLVTLTGVFGIFGSCSDNKCLLHLYWIFLAIWLCAFIAAGVVAVILPNKVLSQGCLADTFGIFQKLDNAASAAMTSSFCKSGCDCYVADTTRISGFPNAHNTTNPSYAQNVQTCPSGIWTATTEDAVLGGLEKAFGCAGWCGTTAPSIFYFSDNNDPSN